ncbi:MAG: LysE family transporter [Acidobacteria bacterium]|nr:LysE family transporter [Acidobacteriota bacterium]
MNLVLLFLLAFTLGFVTAIPLGGSQIEVARRALGGHLRAAVFVAVGSASSDMVYGGVAFFGIAPFLSRPGVITWFYLIGGVLLLALAYYTFRQSTTLHHFDVSDPLLRRSRFSYVIGFVLAFSNPQMIITWLIGKGIVEQLGVVKVFTSGLSVLFVTAGGLGLMSYLTGLAVVLSRLKRSIPISVLTRIYYWLGFVLVGLSFLFLYSSARMWLLKQSV